MIMIEVDYFNEISSMENIDELIKIRDIPRFHLIHSKARRKKCNDRIDEVNIDKITAASQLLLDKDKTDFGIHTIESILANCSIGNAYNNLGVNKLIPHYKCEINKLNTGHEIESYLTDIESRKNIILSYTDEGLKLLIYCNNKTESLKIENDIETKITDYSNENVLQAYDSIKVFNGIQKTRQYKRVLVYLQRAAALFSRFNPDRTSVQQASLGFY